VFAGLLTKVGVYAIIRTQTLLFPDGPADDAILIAALLTMVVGILGAVAQSDIKRLLSFTLVSHIGYMLFGIGLASSAGLSGAIFYVVHHIVIQTTLFLAAGLVERRGGTTTLEHLGGLARLAPLLGVLFFLPALNLAGIPPFSGFLGKLGLLQAGVADGGVLAWLLVAGGVITSLLTLYAIGRVWNLAFWRTSRPESVAADGAVPIRVLPRLMVGSTLALVVLGTGLTVVSGPLFDVTGQAAQELLDREPYIQAVFPEEVP
jgi:multicomponent Na+:H+ antiporter subunit D